MFWFVVILIAVVALFLWLMQTTVKERIINTSTTACMNDLLDFLCSPVNLEKYHPSVRKVTDVEETKELINFRIEENLGIVGSTVVPMVLKMYRDSQFTAVLRLENTSNYAKVILTFIITDNTTEAASKEKGDILPISKIKLTIHVKAPRFFNFFMSSHLVDIWTTALNTTKSILEH